MAEGTALAIAWAGAAYWIGLAIDYLPVRMGATEMPRTARGIFLALAVFGVAIIGARYILRRLMVPLDDRNLALLLEKRFPQFEDSLITAVDTTPDAPLASEPELFQSMLNHAVSVAARESLRIETAEVFDRRPLMRALTGAAIAVLSIVLFASLANDMFSTWSSRFLLSSDQPWPRQTHIEVMGFPESKARKVAVGSNVVIQVRADARKRLPETCTITFQAENGARGRVNMSRNGEVRNGYQNYRYEGNPFDAIQAPVTFDVIGFDHRVSDYRLEVVPSPSVTEVQLTCQLPDYMDLPPRQMTWKPGLALPIGTQVTLTAHTNKPIKHADIQSIQAGETAPTKTIAGNAENTIGYSIPNLQQSTTLKIRLVDTDDINSEKLYQMTINAIEDTPPELDIRLRGIGNAITPDARLPAEGEIKDDYRVKESWFHIRLADGSEQHQVLLQKNLAGEIDETLDLRRHRTADENAWELQPGEKVLINLRATDFYNLSDEPRLGASDEYPLDVVTPEELLALLEARELGLKQRFEQILGELRETRDQLLRLQAELEEADAEEGEASAETQSNSPQLTMRHLRVQRAEQQGGKSEQEIRGVSISFSDIREELINNRVDTPERNERLQRQIVDPLDQVVDDQFPGWLETLRGLDENLASPNAALTASLTVDQANEIIFALEQVLQNMLELETYNELLQLVRSILEDQEAIQEKTQKERKERDRGALLD